MLNHIKITFPAKWFLVSMYSKSCFEIIMADSLYDCFEINSCL